jgi:hypothetical protein
MVQKAQFNKGTGDYKKPTATKPAQKQEGREPDPAGAAGQRASADSATQSTPKAGTVNASDRDN